MMRTDHCGTLTVADIDRTVTLCGWVARRREHGEHLAFVDLRDHTGLVQCVVDHAHDLRSEYVLPVTDRIDADESVRLRYRFVDMRRERMQRNLRIRSKVNSALRRAMERQGF